MIDIIEYDDDITDEQIQEDFEEWVWNEIGDKFYWNDVE